MDINSLQGWIGRETFSQDLPSVRRFVYRGVSPALLGQTLRLNSAALREGEPLEVWVALENGAVSMQAEAFF